jgi:hypothetical protein
MKSVELEKRKYKRLVANCKKLENKLNDELFHVNRILRMFETNEGDFRFFKDVAMFHKHGENGRVILP